MPKKTPATDPWKQEKAGLKARDPGKFIEAARFLLIQRSHPEFRELVCACDTRLLQQVLDPKLKPELRIRAIEALRDCGSPKLKQVAGVFVDAQSKVIEAAALALRAADPEHGLLVSENAVTKLLSVYSRPGDWLKQYDPIRALRHFLDDRVVPALLEAARHEQGAIRREALYGLGEQRAVKAVPLLVDRLQKGKDQEIVAASRALELIATPEAKAALCDKQNYARALKTAKDDISGRFAIGALAQFDVPGVDDDLFALAQSDDGEVGSGACDGLVKRRVETAIPVLAEAALASDDVGYQGRSFLVVAIGVASRVERPAKKPLEALAKILGAASLPQLQAMLSNDQLRWNLLGHLDPEGQARVTRWAEAVAAAIKDPEKRGLFVQAFRPE